MGSDALKKLKPRSVTQPNQCHLFIGDFKKYTVSGVTFSFKDWPASISVAFVGSV